MNMSFGVRNVFGNGMVFQRRKPVRIVGFGQPYAEVRGTFRSCAASAIVNASGKWQLEFPAMEAGGPFTLRISGYGGASVVFSDILVGDVWFCSGQSNMEFPVWGDARFYRLPDGREVASIANDSQLRLLQIAPAISPCGPCDDLPWRPEWLAASSPEAVAPFSAVAYYFGAELRRKYKIPIGLIHGSRGGSQIQPWISREAFIASGRAETLKTLDEALARNDFSDAKRPDDAGALADWVKNKFLASDRAASEEALKSWALTNCPLDGWKECDGWKNSDGDLSGELCKVGVVWLRCEFRLPEFSEKRMVVIHVEHIGDCDECFVDGVKIGETCIDVPAFWERPRDYRVRLAGGTHVLAFRVQNQFASGCFFGLMHVGVEGGEALVNLAECKWFSRVEFVANTEKIGVRPPLPNGGPSLLHSMQTPTTLFNAIVSPLTAMNIRGVIWYQGCSNSNDPHGYEPLQRLMIDSWRTLWRDDEMPFIMTQLAAFRMECPRHRLSDDFWKNEAPDTCPGFAAMRETQEKFLDYPNTGVACAIDIGDHSDVHPPNKRDVGLRLAHEAGRLAYGCVENLPAPRFRCAVVDGATVRVYFDNVGDGLEIRGGEFMEHLFAIAGANGKMRWAHAELLTDNSLRISCDTVDEPRYVHYAFAGWQPGPNLHRRGDGMPVFPFRAYLGL